MRERKIEITLQINHQQLLLHEKIYFSTWSYLKQDQKFKNKVAIKPDGNIDSSWIAWLSIKPNLRGNDFGW